MKIRKISLAIVSALMMAGSAVAIAPVQAFTPENLAENIQRNFSQYWDGGVQWCVGEYGEEQRSLCQYYTTVSLNYQIYVDDSRHQAKAEYFKSLVDKVAKKLYESKYGVESETL